MADMVNNGIHIPKYEPTERRDTATSQNPPTESKLEQLKRKLALAQHVSDNPQDDTDTESRD